MINGLKYCERCCMPETTEGIEFDETGICRACNSSEQKMHINWQERRKDLESILENAKKEAAKNKSPYDCIVPISGGKDSAYQLHVLTKVYNLNVLAVTFSHNWYSEIGWYNLLNCLEQFEVDHMMFTPSRKTVNLAAKNSLSAIGDVCWHCHSGVGSYPLHIATKFNIPLLIWGESMAENSGRASHFEPVRKFDRDYFLKVSAKVPPKKFAKNEEELRAFQIFEPPSAKECEDAGLYGIHLGDFIFWDEEKQTEFIRDTYEWLEDDMEGTYKGYKSAECSMAGLHDFTNYLKRGYGRATFHASMDIRNGLLDRNEAFELAKKYDQIEPSVLQYYLQITGLSKDEFYDVINKERLKQLDGKEVSVVSKKYEKIKKPFVIEFIEKVRERNKKKTREGE